MARIDVRVDDELERKFRTTVCDIYGYKRGHMKAAATEAIEWWIRERTKEKVETN